MDSDRLCLLLDEIVDVELENLLIQHGTIKEIPDSRILHVPGEKLNHIIYILSGTTRHYMMNDEGSEKLLYQLSRGWFFGEICWSNGLPTGIYSQAIDEVKCVFLPLEKAQFLFDTNASFRTAVVRCLANKTFLLRTEVENLAFQPCKKRIQRLFLAAMDKDQTFDSHWHPLKIKYSHAILGSIIGASRVTISKAINEMQNDGFVRTVNRQIQINPDNAE